MIYENPFDDSSVLTLKFHKFIPPSELTAAIAQSSGRHAIAETEFPENAAPTGLPFPFFSRKLTTTEPSLDPEATSIPLFEKERLVTG